MSRFVAIALCLPVFASAQATDAAPNPLLDSLKTGGYVIVFRHAHTDRSKMEDANWSLADRSTQRNLSERGVEDAHAIGRGVKALGIPIGDVLASPMFRTKETAEHAFERADTTTFLSSLNSRPEAKALLTRSVPKGTNRVLVTHNAYLHKYLESAGYGSNGEGDAVVVRPSGDSTFNIVGRVRLADWPKKD